MIPEDAILAVDCGNTRLKWGVCDHGGHWLARGTLPLAELARLDTEWASLPQPDAIVVANVAGASVRLCLEQALGRFGKVPFWLTSQASQGGVANAYGDPAQLGVDRWASLIGARHLHPDDCLVVTAGTATTVDLLGADGVFRGGLVLPGVALMKWSLAQRTAGLAERAGQFAWEPRTTADAIETGCLLAQIGAIEKMFAQLPAGALCLLSGGGAAQLAGHLSMPVRVVDNLALEGLARIAMRKG